MSLFTVDMQCFNKFVIKTSIYELHTNISVISKIIYENKYQLNTIALL